MRTALGHFTPGPTHKDWKGGKHVSSKGYVRLSTNGLRNKYEHRHVIEQLLIQPVSSAFSDPLSAMFTEPGVIRADMHVHHCDGHRRHNCESNLMLLQDCIHNAISRWSYAYYREHCHVLADMPDWVTEGHYE